MRACGADERRTCKAGKVKTMSPIDFNRVTRMALGLFIANYDVANTRASGVPRPNRRLRLEYCWAKVPGVKAPNRFALFSRKRRENNAFSGGENLALPGENPQIQGWH